MLYAVFFSFLGPWKTLFETKCDSDTVFFSPETNIEYFIYGKPEMFHLPNHLQARWQVFHRISVMIQGQCLDGQGQCGGELFHYDECLELIFLGNKVIEVILSWGRMREDERCFVDFLFVDVILGSAVWLKKKMIAVFGRFGFRELAWVGWKLKPSWIIKESIIFQSFSLKEVYQVLLFGKLMDEFGTWTDVWKGLFLLTEGPFCWRVFCWESWLWWCKTPT